MNTHNEIAEPNFSPPSRYDSLVLNTDTIVVVLVIITTTFILAYTWGYSNAYDEGYSDGFHKATLSPKRVVS